MKISNLTKIDQIWHILKRVWKWNREPNKKPDEHYNKIGFKIYFEKFFHTVVDEEEQKDALTSQNNVVGEWDVAQKLDRPNHVTWHNSTCSWHLKHQSNLTEKIDVRIVDGEIIKDCSGSPIDPQVLEKIIHEQLVIGFSIAQVNSESTSSILIQQTNVSWTF